MSSGGGAGTIAGRVLRALTIASATIAGAGLVYMAVATISGVILRYVFRQPNRFLFESTEFALALTVFFALGFVALHDRNVRIDLLPRRLLRTNRALDIGSRFATFAIAIAFAWFALQMLLRDLDSGIRMGSTFGLPRWVLMLGLTVGLLLLAFTELRTGVRRLRRLDDEADADADAAPDSTIVSGGTA